MTELVSIVVPIYNMGDSIERCVHSLCCQDYENIEIILVDDGSKDNSYEISCRLAEKDCRITAYTTENRGSGPARNYGIEKAKGKYIFFPDADDYLVENAISTMVGAMSGGKYDLVVFGYKELNQRGETVNVKEYPDFDKTGKEMRFDYYDYACSTNKYGVQGAPWNKLFDMEIIKKNNIKYPSLRRHQDEAFIAEYVNHVENVHFIEPVLYIHYFNDIKKEWDKFPVDYIDIVIALFKTRSNTILSWNSEDRRTHNLIRQEYICRIIKAMELSFSPKMKFNRKQRKKWLIDAAKKSDVVNCELPENLRGSYQATMILLIEKEQFNLLYITLFIKVFIEKNLWWLFKCLKKLLS